MTPYITTTYSPLDAPVKALWSAYHHLVFVIGHGSFYTINPTNSTITVIAASVDYVFVDLDVAVDGSVLLVMNPLDDTSSVARKLDSNLNNTLELRLPEVFLAGKLTTDGFVVATNSVTNASRINSSSSSSSSKSDGSSQSSGSSQSGESSQIPLYQLRFYHINATGITTDSLLTSGTIATIGYEPNWLFFVVAMTSGDVISVPFTLADTFNQSANTITSAQGQRMRLVNNIGALSAATTGAHWVSDSTSVADQVRVFVGSTPSANDRWDSGKITTNKTAMLYGGGDNLLPGMAYWVSIATHHPDTGWGTPAVQRFVVPKQ